MTPSLPSTPSSRPGSGAASRPPRTPRPPAGPSPAPPPPPPRAAPTPAPPGPGKPLAAFLAGIDGLIRQSEAGPLPAETQIVYVSPLKALGHDIQRNLEGPRAQETRSA